MREAALGGIARLLISGRSAPALIVVLVLYILDCEENKEECQKFKVFIEYSSLTKIWNRTLVTRGGFKTAPFLILNPESLVIRPYCLMQ